MVWLFVKTLLSPTPYKQLKSVQHMSISGSKAEIQHWEEKKKWQGSHPQRKIYITSNCRTQKRNPFAFAGTRCSYILACQERHHEKKRLQEEQHSIRMKDGNPKRSLVCPAYLQEPLCGSHRERALKDGTSREGCTPLHSSKQNYPLKTLGLTVPLSSHNHFKNKMRAWMNSLVLY